MKNYYFDIETTPGKNSEWAIGCLLKNNHYQFFMNVNSFLNYLENYNKENMTIYIHNLKFEGYFLMPAIVEKFDNYNGKMHKQPTNTFMASISDSNDWFNIRIKNKNDRIINFLDSAKLFKTSLKELGKIIGIEKKDYDYTKIKNYRTIKQVPHELLEYLKRDVLILQETFKKYQNIKWKSTIASTTYNEWSKTYTHDYYYYDFYRHFKYINFQYLRRWYFGGLCLYDQNNAFKKFQKIWVYDFNSLYPYVMSKYKMPFGKPSTSQPTENNYLVFYEIWVDEAQSNFLNWVKDYETHIQFKKGIYDKYIYLIGEEYDFFKKTYEGEYKINKKFYFKTKDVFSKYINYWYNIKKQATINNNLYDRALSKLMMNSLSGKFGQNNIRKVKEFREVKDKNTPWNIQRYGKYELVNVKKITKPKYYLPLACAITSYARLEMLKFWYHNKDYIVYGDTDSFYSTKDLNLNSQEIGKLKFEGNLYNFEILRKKAYTWKEHIDAKETLFKASGFKSKSVRFGTITDNYKHLKLVRTEKGCYLKEVTFNFESLVNKSLLDFRHKTLIQRIENENMY